MSSQAELLKEIEDLKRQRDYYREQWLALDAYVNRYSDGEEDDDE